eukprot:CAMPEP_0113625864 /NCGR_PEP_ID=MMETSP0017_2-20120614/13364_1 /TAXON_ID=2856 /ORGANISM="Cylindrotheca closterium" /LENGTH=727 /DNA_ID=CAMNT_0000536001 /DNA_START=644 /DNA_END=2828 /DNA_ORIENTATION=+ /assembly_acc=CAM_ASM_000147
MENNQKNTLHPPCKDNKSPMPEGNQRQQSTNNDPHKIHQFATNPIPPQGKERQGLDTSDLGSDSLLGVDTASAHTSSAHITNGLTPLGESYHKIRIIKKKSQADLDILMKVAREEILVGQVHINNERAVKEDLHHLVAEDTAAKVNEALLSTIAPETAANMHHTVGVIDERLAEAGLERVGNFYIITKDAKMTYDKNDRKDKIDHKYHPDRFTCGTNGRMTVTLGSSNKWQLFKYKGNIIAIEVPDGCVIVMGPRAAGQLAIDGGTKIEHAITDAGFTATLIANLRVQGGDQVQFYNALCRFRTDCGLKQTPAELDKDELSKVPIQAMDRSKFISAQKKFKGGGEDEADRRADWFDQAKKYESFRENNKRRPRSNKNDPKERSLYDWWMRQKNVEHDEEQTAKLIEMGYLEDLEGRSKVSRRANWFDFAKKYKSFWENNKRRPSSRSEDPEERSLYGWWKRQKNVEHDEEQTAKLIEMGCVEDLDKRNCCKVSRRAGSKVSRRDNWFDIAKKYKSFWENNKRHPSSRSEDPEERSLYGWWMRQKNVERDEEQTAKLIEMGYIEDIEGRGKESRRRANWFDQAKKYESFHENNKRRPRLNSKDPKERSLYDWWRRQNNVKHDEEQTAKLIEMGYLEDLEARDKVSRRDNWFDIAKKYKSFWEENKRRPRGNSKDPEERKLYDWWRWQDNVKHDEEQTAKLKSMGYLEDLDEKPPQQTEGPPKKKSRSK